MNAIRLLTVAGFATAAATAQAQTLVPLYDLPGNPQAAPAHPLALSDDGSIVIGYEQDLVFPARNYPRVWRRSAGFVADANPAPPAGRFGQWYDASADGSVLVGTFAGVAHAWRADLGVFEIPLPGSFPASNAYCVSADGTTIAGDFFDDVALRALVWTFAGGLQPVPFTDDYAWVNALDSAGMRAAGAAGDCGFAWQRDAQPAISCDQLESRVCTTMTRSGELAFGGQFPDMYGNPEAFSTCFRWPEGQPLEALGRFADARWTVLLSAAESGDLAVGWASFTDLPELAIVWTRTDGYLTLADFFDAKGFDTTGWHFISARDLTPDGTSIVGEGILNGRVCGFLADLPSGSCRADFNGDQVVDFFDYLDFVAAFAAEDLAADFNGDLTVDFFDYLDFAAAFDAGCDG